MAIGDFQPTIWAGSALRALRKKLVYGQVGVINRNYEGDINEFGNVVKINTIGAVTTNTFSGSVTYEALSDSQLTLSIDQQKYAAFKVEDIDAAQVNVNLLTEATEAAGYSLANSLDAAIAAAMVTGGTDKTASVTDATNPSAASSADNLVDLWRTMTEADAPEDGRWIVVPPWYHARLLKSDTFRDAGKAGSDAALRNSLVGHAAGFDVYVSNNVPLAGADYSIICGHQGAFTLADQIVKTEAVRIEAGFADGVKMLHVYGIKTLRATHIQYATCTAA